jgi:hypothetical protein
LTTLNVSILPSANGVHGDAAISAEATAAVCAADEFAVQHDQSVLIPLLATSDGFMTPDELDAMRAAE